VIPVELADLETPVPVVDLDVLERNLSRMAAYAAEHGLGLRPHTKTHKSPVVGSEQVKRGAIGLTCATLREAEVMSAVTDDILLAYPPVGASKLRRLTSLPASVRIMVALDSAEAIEGLAAAAREAGRPVRVLVECDLGMHRVGVPTVDDAIALIRLIKSRPPLEYAGINFYPGHIRQPRAEQQAQLATLNVELARWLAALVAAGLEPGMVSGGSTPTAFQSHEIRGVTELRPGTYVYNDREIVSTGAAERADCAFTVLATVVSTAVPGQAVIDAGSKALGREPLRVGIGEGFGELLDRPEVTVKSMSEEHGILDLSKTTWRPKVGDQVRVIPNHVCIVTHLNDVIWGIRGDQVETSWAVAARGRAPVKQERGETREEEGARR
jgi:D-serine deaminase-like pyridoxal phosphate-dependent protein